MAKLYLGAVIFIVLPLFADCTAEQEGSNAEDAGDADCSQLGFSRSKLDCGRCRELTRFDLKSLEETCLKCCHESDESSQKIKYAHARLEICNCNLANFPQIQAFVKSDQVRDFPRLKIKHVRGSLQVMKMLDENENLVEELSVKKWDSDTIVEFLHEHLQNP